MFSLKRGVEILSGLKMPITLTKVLFSNNTYQTDDEYLNYLSLGMRVQWAENRIYFPLDTTDRDVLLESEKVAKINIKDLTKEYKQALAFIIQKMTGTPESDIRKLIKQLEKENDGGTKWQ